MARIEHDAYFTPPALAAAIVALLLALYDMPEIRARVEAAHV